MVRNKMVVRKTFDLTFNGKNYRIPNVNSVETVMRRLKISRVNAVKIIEGNKTVLIISGEGNVRKLNLDENNRPLLEREFKIRRIDNNKLFSGVANGNTIAPTSGAKVVKINLIIDFTFEISDILYTRSTNGFVEIMASEITENAFKIATEYTSGIPVSNLQVINIRVISEFTNQILDFDGVTLRENDYPSLVNYFGKKYIVNIKSNDGDCLKSFIMNKHKILPPDFDTLFNKEVTVKDLYNYCKQVDCFFTIYDINGKIIKKKQVGNPEIPPLIGVVTFDHIYTLNDYPTYKTYKKTKLLPFAEMTNRISEMFKTDEIPNNIKLDKNNKIIGYSKGSQKFFSNDEYENFEVFMNTFGIPDIPLYISKFSFIDCLLSGIKKDINSRPTNGISHEELGYINVRRIVDVSSFFINTDIFNCFDLEYQTEEPYDEKDTECFDKNKSYSCALHDLPFLPYTDIRQTEIYDYKNELIRQHYFYTFEADNFTILTPSKFGILCGRDIKRLQRHNIKFTIKKCIAFNSKSDNFYTAIINDILTTFPHDDLVKESLNIHIGRFQPSCKTSQYSEFDRFLKYGTSEYYSYEGYKNSLLVPETEYYMNTFKGEKMNYSTKAPIRNMVMFESNYKIYLKCLELNIKDKEIVTIRTDGVRYIKSPTNSIVKETEDFKGWKKTNVTPYPSVLFNKVKPLSIFGETQPQHTIRVLHSAYAGAGKTFDVKNVLVPKLEEEGKTYIILTPHYDFLFEYIEDGLNCSVIAMYENNNKLPTEDVIIIDEIGICGKIENNFLIRCLIGGKEIHTYGDFGQLLPVGEVRHFNSPYFLKYFYTDIVYSTDNFRNEFTIEYYDKLIDYENWDYPEYGIDQVKKYSVPYKEADVIISYRNSVRKSYNAKKLKHHGFDDSKHMLQEGVSVVCLTNILQLDITFQNKQTFIVEKIENDIVHLINKIGEKYSINVKKFTGGSKNNPNFDLNYARTLYGVQSKSLNSFHFCEDDYERLERFPKYTDVLPEGHTRVQTENKNCGREVYTIISRLKTDNCRSLNS